MTANENSVLDFLKTLEQRKATSELERFYHPDVEQIEFPNAITKNTAIRSLKDLKDAAERGSKILIKEEYEVKNLFSVGDTVIVECTWRGTLAVAFGNLPVGGQLTAHFAQFFEFKEGKIFRQRNYDCFEPFS